GEAPMPVRYLVGPVSAERACNYKKDREAGLALAFDVRPGVDLRLEPSEKWETLLSRLPACWRPDCGVLDLDYTTVPSCLWSAPVPLIAQAPDWHWLWSFYRLILPHVDLVLTDGGGVEALSRQGIASARQANLFGLQSAFLDSLGGMESQERT